MQERDDIQLAFFFIQSSLYLYTSFEIFERDFYLSLASSSEKNGVVPQLFDNRCLLPILQLKHLRVRTNTNVKRQNSFFFEFIKNYILI